MIAILSLTNVKKFPWSKLCISQYILWLSVSLKVFEKSRFSIRFLQVSLNLISISPTHTSISSFLHPLSCISQLTLPFLMIVKNHRLFIAFDLNSIWFNLFFLETFVADSLMKRSLLHMDYPANNNELFGWYATAQEIKQNEREVNNKTVDIVKGYNKNKMKYNATSRSLSKSN